MSISSGFVAYAFSALLSSGFVYCIFCGGFFQESPPLYFFSLISCIFFAAIFFVLSWYYSILVIKNWTRNNLIEFTKNVINTCNLEVQPEEIRAVTNRTIEDFAFYEDCRFELLGFSIPFLLSFLVVSGICTYHNCDSWIALLISCFISVVVIKTANEVIDLCNIKSSDTTFSDMIKNIASASNGIQYFGSEKFILDRLNKQETSAISLVRNRLIRCVWKSFAYICLLFVFICFLYVVDSEYATENVLNITNVEVLFFCCIFFFVMFLISIFRFSKIKKIKLNDITKYKTDIYSNEQTLKQLDTDNLFLTFHGIYFQDPAKLSDRPVFEDLSFAVLPGEFVAITGENLKDGHYIFDLVLRFHKPQSGKIYIAGSHIENIRINSIRSAIGIFNEDFGLIDGTIFDNIAMLIGDYAKIQNVAYNVGLEAFLDRELFDADGDVAIPQEILFRLQMARIAIRRPKIVLIEEPAFFESEENEQIFFDIVKHMAKRKTVIVITGKPMLAINSDKILYLGIKKTIFGSHAELSSDPDYQQFIAINSDLD